MAEASEFWVTSGVSAFDAKPFVNVGWGGETGRLAPEEAEELGLTLIAAARASVLDASLVDVMREHGVSDEVTETVLRAAREARE